MDNNTTSRLQLSMTYGAFAGVGIMLITYIYVLRGNLFMSASDFFCYMALIIAISIGSRKYRDDFLNGSAKYGQIVGFGMLTTLFTAILIMLFNYVLLKYIDKDLMSQLFLALENEMLNRGQTEGDVESLIKMYRMVLTPFLFGFVRFLQYMFMGLVFSLIVAIFVKRDNNPAQQSNPEA